MEAGTLIKVAVIEPNHFALEGMANFVRRTGDLELVAATRSVEEFDDLEVHADVALLDLQLSGRLQGAAAVSELCNHGTKVLILSIDNAPAAVMAAITAGAGGYLTKHAEPSEVHEAIRSVHLDVFHISAELAGYIKDDLRPVLTPREIEVLDLVQAGNANADVARRLHITEKAVENKMNAIRAKLPGITRHRPPPTW